jgi:sugar/nucleoside kinase (ribokinase family)
MHRDNDRFKDVVMTTNRPDYLMLGHFTRDLLPDGAIAPGGTSFYASRTVDRLGKQVAVVSAPADLPADWPTAIWLSFRPELSPPTFENRYTPQGRVQILHTDSGAISLADIPEPWRSAEVVHLGPIAAETPEDLVFAFPNALLGVTPQGWMREWGQLPGPISYKPWRPAPAILQRIDALVLSIEDVRGDEALVREYAQHCRLVLLTRSAQGATLFLNGEANHIAAFPAEERDPTGAGDVFAASLLVRLAETHDPFAAARFAACVAAGSVEGRGVSAIPTRQQVEQRLHPDVG